LNPLGHQQLDRQQVQKEKAVRGECSSWEDQGGAPLLGGWVFPGLVVVSG